MAVCLLLSVLWCSGCSGESKYPALRDSQDDKLQMRVMNELNSDFPPEIVAAIIKDKRASMVVVDITDLKRPRVAVVNPETMFYTASLPKIAILACAVIEIDAGQLQLDDALLEKMTLMIRRSSNTAATQVLQRVGIERVAEILQSERYRFYDHKYGGGLWVGRGYGGGKAWRRDPTRSTALVTVLQPCRWHVYIICC